MRMMLLAILCMGLGACDKPAASARTERMVAYNVVAPAVQPPAPPEVRPPAPQADAITVSVPRMAYSYR